MPVEIGRDGSRRHLSRTWVPEAPVALEFNGLAYAVMMATPGDLADFAIGFAIAEQLVERAEDVSEIDSAETDKGWIVRAQIAGAGTGKLTERVRARVSESSCGLCGIENLEALAVPLPKVAAHDALDHAAIFAAIDGLKEHQHLGRATNAAHAAAFADTTGAIAVVREDVGRHNAMDKLVGALARDQRNAADGFLISTARCSYEIVEKAVRAGATRLVTVSLPTTLAVDRARASGLTLYVLAREDSILLVDPKA